MTSRSLSPRGDAVMPRSAAVVVIIGRSGDSIAPHVRHDDFVLRRKVGRLGDDPGAIVRDDERQSP